MPNGINTVKSGNPAVVKEILILKIMIMIAVLILPLAFMFIDMSRGIIIRQKLSGLDTKSILSDKGQNLDFQAAIPKNYLGEISQVPQEKIDTLFNNLK
ncbi:MAG: hypothetical protein NTX82_00575 [Candidatus Parcubacteria bacterium]|nr:hypothetical protein [Candidatus Parcubacteria bacterium]